MGPVRALVSALQIVSLVQAVMGAGHCDSVFRGFSDCLLKLGDNMANYPQDLDDRQNLDRICRYWDNFHSCAATALTDCQQGAEEMSQMWEKLKTESRNLDFRGSLFELCGSNNASVRRGHSALLLTAAASTLLLLLL
uniref:Neuritin n=1 Tax=Knipowitschia caucasica TaxID=637954 RepID=A0AAV2L7G5_KNICA